MDLGLKDRVVLVTGSSRGIGRAAVRLFAQEGARVVVTYSERREAAESVADEIRANDGHALVRPFHLESPESMCAVVEDTRSHWGNIDVLVNNAVATKTQSPQDSVSEWQALIRANIEGTYHAIQTILPLMRANRWGRIVNVSSALAVDGMPGFAWYTTAKAALHGLTRTLSKELGPFGILVNAVMPGLTLTEEQPVRISGRHLENVATILPIRRLPTPEEVARVIVFLSSPSNAIITGEILRVSGGS